MYVGSPFVGVCTLSLGASVSIEGDTVQVLNLGEDITIGGLQTCLGHANS